MASFCKVVGQASGQWVKPKNTKAGAPAKSLSRAPLAGVIGHLEVGDRARLDVHHPLECRQRLGRSHGCRAAHTTSATGSTVLRAHPHCATIDTMVERLLVFPAAS